MIKRVDPYIEDKVAKLLDIYTMEELLELCDITPEEVIELLVDNGYIELPDGPA